MAWVRQCPNLPCVEVGSGERIAWMWHYYIYDYARKKDPEKSELGYATEEEARIAGRKEAGDRSQQTGGAFDLDVRSE
jgi:hypothetical protein